MTQLSVLKTSSFAMNFIRGPHSGLIHSMYRNTVNLMLDQQIIALQTASTPLSPISVILPVCTGEMQSLFFDPSGICCCDNRSITVRQGGGTAVQLTLTPDSEICSSRLDLTQMINNSVQSYINTAEQILQASDRSGFGQMILSDCDEITDPVWAAAYQYLSDSRMLFLQKQWTDAAKSLCRLIGLGGGLTPSGDDFLCGLVAAVQKTLSMRHPFTRELTRQLWKNLSRTHDISRAFLSCALKEEYSTAVLDFFKMGDTGQPDIVAALDSAFRAIGHSSGMDSLCGICYGLKLAAKA